MPDDPPPPEASPPAASPPAAPPHVDPFPAAPSQFADAAARPPEALEADAAALLDARFGPSDAAVATGHARGSAAVLSEQTHYAEGFALVAPLRAGLAVAVRRADAGRLACAGDARTWPLPPRDDLGAPPWVHLTAALAQTPARAPLEVAIASAVPDVGRDGAHAALAVALWRALRTLRGAERLPDALRADLDGLRAAVADALGLPLGLAPLFAAAAGTAATLLLVDTATREFLPVELPAPTALALVLLAPRARATPDAEAERRRRAAAQEVLRHLRASSFPHLRSFRELEHRDLHRALDALPPRLRPLAQHLVTENRRVQRMVTALRRGDWQMTGALLLMTHASRRDHLGATHPAADALVAAVEGMTFDGLYGAGQTGRDGPLVLAGQPHTTPAALDRLAAHVATEADAAATDATATDTTATDTTAAGTTATDAAPLRALALN